MNISKDTLFFGEQLSIKKGEFAHKVSGRQWKSETVWINPERGDETINFIVSFDDMTECAGTAIIEKGWAKAVYIAGFSDAGEFCF